MSAFDIKEFIDREVICPKTNSPCVRAYCILRQFLDRENEAMVLRVPRDEDHAMINGILDSSDCFETRRDRLTELARIGEPVTADLAFEALDSLQLVERSALRAIMFLRSDPINPNYLTTIIIRLT